MKKQLLILLLLAIYGYSISAQDLPDNCHVAVVDDSRTLAFYDIAEDNPQPIASVQDFSLNFVFSPNSRYVAVEERQPEDSLRTQIVIYEILNFQLNEVAALPDIRFIQGGNWSNNSNRLLLQDDFFNFSLHVFDIASGEINPFPTAPVLAIYQATWTLDDSQILFAAEETPFPTTDYGQSGVVALYAADAKTLAYLPITSPSESVGYYFNRFLDSQAGDYIFSACSEDTELCQLMLMSNEETVGLPGRYTILGTLTSERILVSQSEFTSDALIFRIDYLDLTSKELVPILTIQTTNLDLIVSIMNWSDDGRWLAFVDGSNTLNLLDLRNGSITPIESDYWGPYDWHPYQNIFLYRTQDQLIVYDVEGAAKIIQLSEDAEFVRARWVCI